MKKKVTKHKIGEKVSFREQTKKILSNRSMSISRDRQPLFFLLKHIIRRQIYAIPE
jgi:hypothetical protein